MLLKIYLELFPLTRHIMFLFKGNNSNFNRELPCNAINNQ